MAAILKGAMIGAGAWSVRQLTAWQEVRGAQIVALCDRHPDRRGPVAKQFNIDAEFDDLETMLNHLELDFIDICVRPRSHAQIIEMVADRGIDMLCQKPFCTSMEEAKRMADYCEAKGVRIMINENFRWQEWYRKAKKIIDDGLIGKPFLARHHSRVRFTLPAFTDSQTYLAEMEQLVGFEMGPHYLDTLTYLFGEPSNIYARTHKISPHIAGDDVMVAILGYEGLTVIIDTSWASVPVPGLDRVTEPQDKEYPHILEVDGTGGTLVVGPDFSIRVVTDKGIHRWDDFDKSLRPSRRDAQQHFIDCLLTGAAFETDVAAYLKTMGWVWALYESAQSQTMVSVGAIEQF